jgi:dethiobiotin synthetase
MNNTFFITGTDTGIGKTFVTCILMQFIKFHHKRVIGMKPIAAGVDIKKGETANEDVNLLQYESSLKLKVGEINTYSFDEAIAPHIAAQKYNIEIDFKKIKMHAASLKSQDRLSFD